MTRNMYDTAAVKSWPHCILHVSYAAGCADCMAAKDLQSQTGQLSAAQADTLRALANGKACPAGVASVLDRIAAGRAVTTHDVYYVTRTRDEVANFYARLRAAGVDIPADSGIPVGGIPQNYPAKPIELVTVRGELQTVARILADTMDRAAVMVAEADSAYARALGW